MVETVDDIRVNLIETTGNLGITLSSDNTRIKHSKTGVFDISSNGSIEIVSGNGTTNNGSKKGTKINASNIIGSNRPILKTIFTLKRFLIN